VKKVAMLCIVMTLLAFSGVAFANLNDTRNSIAQTYGEYRLVLDTDNQPWTKAEWETKGYQRAKASSYTHYFNRNGIGMQMEVQYESDKQGAFAILQRVTPNSAIKIKELRTYFPELVSLLDSPKGEYFSTYGEVTRNFQEEASPVKLGLVVKLAPAPKRDKYYTLMVFNIQDEGRFVKDPKYINGDTYIREFLIQRVLTTDVSEKLYAEWPAIKKFF